MTSLRPLPPAFASPAVTATVPTQAWGLPRSRWLKALAGLGVAMLLLSPLAAVRVPFLLDYPNHLARMHVLATGAAAPALRAMVRIEWAVIPNMVMDLVVPALAQVMPLSVAGRLFIALAILLPPLGVVALHRAWFRARLWWPWIAVLTAVNACLVLGFLNYAVGVGLALFGAAWHARARDGADHWPAIALATLLGAAWGVACLLSHIVAFGLLVLLMLSTEAAQLARRPRLRRALPIAAAVLVPLVLYHAFGPSRNYTSAGTLAAAVREILHDGMLSHPYFRARWVFFAATGESVPIGLLAMALLVLPVAWAAWRRRLAVAPQMLLAFAGLAIAYAVLPEGLAGAGMVYDRLNLPLVLVGIAGVHPRLAGHGAAALALAVVMLLGAQSVVMWRRGAEQEALLRQVERVIAPIPPGARVLAVRDGRAYWDVDPDEPAAHRILGRSVNYQHLPALVTLERDAFWPMVFSFPGKQPVQFRPAYAQDAQTDGLLPLTAQLGPAASIPPPPARCDGLVGDVPCQLWSWPLRYDFLLRLNAHDDPPPQAAHLREVTRDGWAALYRVQRDPP